jgi:hypothetical protein
MRQPASPTAVLSVLAGPLKGRRHALALGAECAVGSDPSCQLVLAVPGVGARHARIRADAQAVTLVELDRERGVWVNDIRVGGSIRLNDGDYVWLGPPGERQSVLLQATWAAPEGTPGFEASSPPEEAVETDVVISAEELAPASLPVGPAEGDLGADDFFIASPEPEPAEAPRDATDVLLSAWDPVPAAGERGEPAGFGWDLGPSQGDAPVAAPPAPAHEAPPVAPVFSAEEAERDAVLEASAAAGAEPEPVPAPVAPPAPPPSPPRAAPRGGAQARSSLRGHEGPPPRPAASPPPPKTRPAPRPAASRWRPAWVLAVSVLALTAAAGLWFRSLPRIVSFEPDLARVGDVVVVRGVNFAPEAGASAVIFAGDRNGRVVQASADTLRVEVPDLGLPPGPPVPVRMHVRAGRRSSFARTLSVHAAPRITGVSPGVAMPGELVSLVGSGWRPGAAVTFGSATARVASLTASTLEVEVPPLAEGSEVSVAVTVDGVLSNPAPFVVGRVPLVSTATPALAWPGDLVTLAGRGFHLRPSANQVAIGGASALVLSASDAELKVVVPFSPPGPAPVEVRVPGSDHVGRTSVTVNDLGDAVGFRFVAEPATDPGGGERAVVGTALGPAFLFSASGGRTAAARAFEAQARLNDAGRVLAESPASSVELRSPDTAPAVGLAGGGLLLEPAAEDASAHEKPNEPAVSPARLAGWWAALTEDWVRLLIRNERPARAAAFPSGRVLADLHDQARRTGGRLSRAGLARSRPGLRASLLVLAGQVPRGFAEPVAAAAGGAASALPAAGQPLRLAGSWSGAEREAGEERYVTMTFERGGGSLTYERGLRATLRLESVSQPRRDTVRYTLRAFRRTLYYEGRWDGRRMAGRIFTDPSFRTAVGTFELEPVP